MRMGMTEKNLNEKNMNTMNTNVAKLDVVNKNAVNQNVQNMCEVNKNAVNQNTANVDVVDMKASTMHVTNIDELNSTEMHHNETHSTEMNILTNFNEMTITEVQNLVKDIEPTPELAVQLRADGRQGLAKLADQIERQLAAQEKLQNRYEEMLSHEKELWNQGVTVVAGVDEVGRGPLAGPVVAAAVVIGPDFRLLGLNDSKQLTEEEREEYYAEILKKAKAVGVGIVDEKVIDEINILQASFQAMTLALAEMSAGGLEPGMILVDGDKAIPALETPQRPIVEGDGKSISIAAASVVAKVTRDRLMIEMGKQYPGYGFERNKGYGSPEHLEGLRKLGPSPIHRMTFSLVRQATYSHAFQTFVDQLAAASELTELREVGLTIGRGKDSLSEQELDELRQIYSKLEKKLKTQLKKSDDLGDRTMKII